MPIKVRGMNWPVVERPMQQWLTAKGEEEMKNRKRKRENRWAKQNEGLMESRISLKIDSTLQI